MFEEAEKLNSNYAVDEESRDNDKEKVDGFGQNRKDGLENFLSERNLVQNYVKVLLRFRYLRTWKKISNPPKALSVKKEDEGNTLSTTK